MSAALFIVVEKELPGMDSGSVSGKSLSKNLDSLDEAAQKLHVRPLSELISVNPDEASAFLEDEGVDMDDLPLPAEQWFDAEEGLQTVEALLQSVQTSRPRQEDLIEDLLACQKSLLHAKQEKVRFHFAVDF